MKKVISVFFAILMVFSVITITGLTAFAAVRGYFSI